MPSPKRKRTQADIDGRKRLYATNREREREQQRAWRDAQSPEDAHRRREGRKAHDRLRRTGWSTEDVDAAWLAQKGMCAICTCDLLRGGRSAQSMTADHCHTSKRKRALLCSMCNKSLGNYEKHQRTYITIDIYETYIRRFTHG